MVLQLQDCVDVKTMLYPQYDFVFLFDHSSGHDTHREDGLDLNKMTKGLEEHRANARHGNQKRKGFS
jgi:hypothetical protein